MTRRIFPLPAFLAVWLAASAGGCRTTCVSDTADELRPPQEQRPLPTTCPSGHTTLRDTPVLYGLLGMTPELRRQIDNHEVIEGGCVFMPGHSPVRLLVCAACQYQYDPVTAEWRRDSDDAKSFQQHLSPLVRGFPLLTRHRPTYQQVVWNGRVLRESVRFRTGEPVGKVRERIDEFLSGHGLAVPSTQTERGSVYTRQTGVVGDRTLTIITEAGYDRDEGYVSVELAGK